MTTTDIHRLIQELDSDDERVRQNAAAALAREGAAAAAAIPPLAILTAQGIRVTSWSAATAIRRIGLTDPDSIATLIVAHADPDLCVRKPAAHALGAVGESARGAIPAVARLLDDHRPAVRGAACFALGSIGQDAEDTLLRLRNLAELDPDFHVRRQARFAVSQITGEPDSDSHPETDDENEVLAEHRSWAEGMVPLEETRVGRRLEEMLQSDQTALRLEAIESITSEVRDEHLAQENALMHLEEALRDVRAPVRAAAAHSLGEAGPEAKGLAPALLNALKDADADVRKAAFFAIHRIIR